MLKNVLIANRGEVAIRIARACGELGIGAVAVAPDDDRSSLHMSKADRAVGIPGAGAAAYLDGQALVAAALASGCDAVHPGYGFLSESAEFARACAAAGLKFVGPSPEALELFGDKAKAIGLARRCDVPVARNTDAPASPEAIRSFMAALPAGTPIMIKAVAGGGGRGMRVVHDPSELAAAWERCASEAQAAFGRADVYAEELIGRARHIEVQVAGDASGHVIHLHERECSVQRRHQKLIELAPSPWLEPALRTALCRDAVRLAKAAGYVGIGTVEFLVEVDAEGRATGRHVFIEMNPRLQVEHTVTEEVTGVDLVHLQLALAAGTTLAELDLAEPPSVRGHAMQLRVNMETLQADGTTLPSGGVLAAFAPPGGAGVRVETSGYSGYEIHPGFDALLAKLVVHTRSGGFDQTAAKAYRALCEFEVSGVATSIPLLQAILRHDDFRAGRADTRFVERAAPELIDGAAAHPSFHAPRAAAGQALRVIADDVDADGAEPARSPMRGRVVAVEVAEGEAVGAGQTVVVVEAMKMEHAIVAACSGTVERVLVAPGDTVQSQAPLLLIRPGETAAAAAAVGSQGQAAGGEALAEIETVRARTLDAQRPEAMARLARRQSLSARQRIALLADDGSFTEIGGLALAEGLGAEAPGDGVVVGTARVAGRPVVVVAQDFSVFGGSAGHLGTAKMDRGIAVALKSGRPLVMLLDGGGHRIQDGQNSRHYAHGSPTFHDLARLSGWVPVVSAVLGAGFAANTNFSGLADLIVMVRGKSTMGLAGPALVKAGTGEDISIQALGGAEAQVDHHGLADLGVASEEEAIATLRRFLSYLPDNAQAARPTVPYAEDAAVEQARAEDLLGIIPANSRRSYDVRRIVERLADADSVMELKPTFAGNIVTALGRLRGRPVGFVANQAAVLGGMLDSPACEKAAHFVGMCDAFGLPLVYLIDVPGFSIGSDAERTTLGKRSAKLIFELGQATVPRLSVVLRKGYGLGYVAMAGGRSFDADAALAWPTAEICAMSVEGSVDVAHRRAYETASDPVARRQEIIDDIRSRIGPLQAAQGFGIDDIIDPRSTRARLIEVLDRVPARRDNGVPARFRPISPI
ncbi:acetyl-CoA carboxylase family protein [Chelatococcus reniformis]|uniref:acetyl-CoA carboxylase n=1 Tax=Chelatococcus reniformis TaxID=1494448 RepID=A0A916XHX8_9HYPH|nr:carboxyl transferase domain-containing protein [Chelatococcus reniformis]GGC74495.1 pyruvate carboxylase [Chelatococcus reniformis]